MPPLMSLSFLTGYNDTSFLMCAPATRPSILRWTMNTINTSFLKLCLPDVLLQLGEKQLRQQRRGESRARGGMAACLIPGTVFWIVLMCKDHTVRSLHFLNHQLPFLIPASILVIKQTLYPRLTDRCLELQADGTRHSRARSKSRESPCPFCAVSFL